MEQFKESGWILVQDGRVTNGIADRNLFSVPNVQRSGEGALYVSTNGDVFWERQEVLLQKKLP